MTHNTFLLEDEVRNEFYIPASIKQCWAVELDILAAIDALCQKYNIKYYAEYGTLLGAVRHGGFIPWDDDLDIGMFRTDLDKFLSIAHELPSGFAVHSYKNRPDYTQFIYNVVNTEHISFEPDHLRKFHGMPYICGVDIFVMDNVSDDDLEEKERCTKANYIIQIADEIFAGNISHKESIEIIKNIEIMTGEAVSPLLYANNTSNNVDLRIRLYEIGENLFTFFNNEQTSMIAQIMPWGLNGERHYPREYYDELVRIPFENTTIPVPSRYNSMLKNRYGDYMRIIKDAGAHNYPCFAIQQDNFRNMVINELGEEAYNQFLPSYSYSTSDLAGSNNKNACQDVDTTFSHKIVVFLPFNDSYWSTMQQEYDQAIANNSNEVYVIPIPYYYKDFATKELIDEQFSIDAYPENVELYDWQTIDLESLHPDVIYIQNPYDEYNPVMSVHPALYSSILKKYTDKLIYVPWFTTSDFNESETRSYKNMSSYCTMPGVVNADIIILSSQSLKDIYIKKLTEWSGCKDSDVWTSKIVVKEYKDTESITSNSIFKKTLMYYIGLGQIIEGNMDMLDKLYRTLNIMNEYRETITLYIKVDSTFEESLSSLRPELYNKYMDIINPIKDDPDWIYDNTEYVDYAVNYCDAFYGDAGYVANLFRQSAKPCMVQNINI